MCSMLSYDTLEENKMIQVSKTKAEGKYLYINLHGFKDEIEQEVYFKKIQQLLKDSRGRLKVF
ncbi:hypothetical protein [Nitrososphaeria virus YSH_1032793]|uniref:Uncharacterized protein n=1 Tax=Nitrososphaeria virus YSH_1032793 TaxID=3071320 RepID=A0A976UAF0_9CAUD|nr:hypothetical protein QKV91_gp59 [Yangshan Harbor Nitrososphaeria virus]UVF62263.1 hypothetical protein [Nitrososphaeria virus YSH_1032793]